MSKNPATSSTGWGRSCVEMLSYLAAASRGSSCNSWVAGSYPINNASIRSSLGRIVSSCYLDSIKATVLASSPTLNPSFGFVTTLSIFSVVYLARLSAKLGPRFTGVSNASGWYSSSWASSSQELTDSSSEADGVGNRRKIFFCICVYRKSCIMLVTWLLLLISQVFSSYYKSSSSGFGNISNSSMSIHILPCSKTRAHLIIRIYQSCSSATASAFTL